MNIANIDRRRFLLRNRIVLTLPWFETFAADLPSVSTPRKRLACFYVPDGVPMPVVTIPPTRTGPGSRTGTAKTIASPNVWNRSNLYAKNSPSSVDYPTLRCGGCTGILMPTSF